MGLLTIIRKQRRKEREMRILMLGLDNAGKTTIVRRLKGGLDLSKVMPTLGFNIDTLIHRSYSLNIWDVGGQKTLRPYWRNYFEATDAIIWVIDSTDRARLSDTSIELNQLLLEEALALNSKPTGHRWRVMACSAISGMNVMEGLDWVVDEVASRLYLLQ
ncbi:hypothetical protein PGTUg99_017533 [Puccinia graminis f. sp. tritici]|uniref:ADP-ribosylation factor-like protein 2 n=1 Tax=Puccinia graminis f. sp. tritici TaxID=56615 RepID=A0A5B0NZV5_PUCGR|nr:hypothetical protein PGTUg99_017533 [Puccinia graminis f. sp. tritici]